MILREKHSMPTIEETLQEISGAKVFSKLDFNMEFQSAKLVLSPWSTLQTRCLKRASRCPVTKLKLSCELQDQKINRNYRVSLAWHSIAQGSSQV